MAFSPEQLASRSVRVTVEGKAVSDVGHRAAPRGFAFSATAAAAGDSGTTGSLGDPVRAWTVVLGCSRGGQGRVFTHPPPWPLSSKGSGAAGGQWAASAMLDLWAGELGDLGGLFWARVEPGRPGRAFLLGSKSGTFYRFLGTVAIW